MPLLGQPDTSIYGQTQLWNAPGLAPQGRAAGGQAGPTAAQMKFGADQQVEQDINALAQQYGDDYDGLVKAVTSVHPDRGLAMGKALEEYRQNAAKTDVENNKVAVSKIDLGTRWLQEAIEDPSKYPVVRARAVSAGGLAIDQILPAPDDPDLQNKLVGVVSAAQPTKDYLETRTKAMQSYMDGNKVDGTLTLLAGSKTPAQWDASTKIVKMGGMGQLLQGIPDAASAQQMLADRQATKPQKAEAAGSDYHQYAERWAREHGTTFENLTTKQEQQARKEYGQADDKAPTVRVSVAGGAGPKGGKSDVQETVAGMIDGSLPPVLPGRATKEYNAIMAESHRQHFDLAKAAQDWTATSKYLGTLNGAQQTRLRQATEQVSETVPLVRALVTEWDSAGIPYLSAGNLAAAKKGAYGNKAQSLANRLDAQIADMTSELGTVYKGGNSSTDESLKLAARNLQGDWSKKAALDALDQIEQNIKYRRNSMKLGPVSDSGNRYAPNLGGPETSGGTVRMKAPNGQMKDVPADRVDFYKSKGAVVVQ